MDEEDDPIGLIPTPMPSKKPVYGSNTIEISCDLDAEDEAEALEKGIQADREQEPFNNPQIIDLMSQEMGRSAADKNLGSLAKLVAELPDFKYDEEKILQQAAVKKEGKKNSAKDVLAPPEVNWNQYLNKIENELNLNKKNKEALPDFVFDGSNTTAHEIKEEKPEEQKKPAKPKKEEEKHNEMFVRYYQGCNILSE